MFTAYKIGITVALANHVTSALMGIGRDFVRTDAEAQRLHTTLNKIKILGASGLFATGLGMVMFKGIGELVKPASEYVHQLELLKANHLEAKELADSTKAAWAAITEVPTSTVTQNLAAIRELRMVFGNTNDAIEHMPTVQKMQAVLGTLNDKEGNKAFSGDEAYTIAKALEMKGSVRTTADFDNAANQMVKAMIASGGKVTGADFLATFKLGRLATTGWNDAFTYSVLPTLIQEMKSSKSGIGGGPGNPLQSAYAAVVGGTIPQKNLKMWDDLGLLDKSKIVYDKVGASKGVHPGGVAGWETFVKNPYEWAQQTLLPSLLSHGFDTMEKQQQALQYLFPNRTASFLMNQMTTQGWKFDRDQKLIRQASGIEAFEDFKQNDPKIVFASMHTALENLKIALGKDVVPMLLSWTVGFTNTINTLSQTIERHPDLAKGLVTAFGALATALTFSGVVWALQAAFYGLRTAMTLGGLISFGGTAAAGLAAGAAGTAGVTTAAAVAAGAAGTGTAVAGGAAVAAEAGVLTLLASPVIIAALVVAAGGLMAYLLMRDPSKNEKVDPMDRYGGMGGLDKVDPRTPELLRKPSSKPLAGDFSDAPWLPSKARARTAGVAVTNEPGAPVSEQKALTGRDLDELAGKIAAAMKNVSVNLDGKRIGDMIFGGAASAMNGPPTSVNRFDGSQGYAVP